MARLLKFLPPCSLAVALLLDGHRLAPAAETPPKPGTIRAATLVDEALKAELTGDAAARAARLSEAKEADPDYAPAHWHSGEVLLDGKWQPVAKVPEVVAADERRQEYRRRRDAATDDPIDQAELARWCMHEGLTAEERVHWIKVLQADLYHEQARDRLGLQEYRGGLYTHEQIAELKDQAKQAEKDLARFKPVFIKLCRQAASADSQERASALAEIRNVSDPAAVAALEYAVRKYARSDRAVRELNLAVVAALASMPQHRATMRLLDYAVYANLAEVRYEAAAALRPRPMTDFVPPLMAALTAPLEADIDVNVSPDGIVSVGQHVRQAGPEADQSSIANRDYVALQRLNRNGQPISIWPTVYQSFSLARQIASNARNRIEQANAATSQFNARIETVLLNATDLRIPESVEANAHPQAWWQAWFDYNELYSEDHPTYEVADYATSYLTPPPTMSCFAAGTPVWTQSGPVPIEQVVPGDMVLSQGPPTGELTYKPVLQTTLRPPTRMVSLNLPGELITATAGHRFWSVGEGWRMAKFLTAGMGLHGVNGEVKLGEVQKADEVNAHNLVVDDFHTYFVGQSKILVHDNGCPRPTTARVPGGELAIAK